jgi:hypothetical protein
MSDTSPKKFETSLVNISLVALIALPGSLELIVLSFFDGPGVGDLWGPTYDVMTLVCSAASALGFARLFRLHGFARIVTVVLLAVILFAVSRFVTICVAALLFMPRH